MRCTVSCVTACCAVLTACCAACCVQTSRESALRSSEGRAKKQREEQEALGVLLTQREAAVLDKEQELAAVGRYGCSCCCLHVAQHACMCVGTA
jgi:hypothetical protein